MKVSVCLFIAFAGFTIVAIKHFIEMVFSNFLVRFISAIFGAMTQSTEQPNSGFRPQQIRLEPAPPPQPRNQGIRNLFSSFFRAINIRSNNGRNRRDTSSNNAQTSSLMDTILLRKLSYRSSLVSWKSSSFCVGEEMVLIIKVGIIQNTSYYFYGMKESKKRSVQRNSI